MAKKLRNVILTPRQKRILESKSWDDEYNEHQIYYFWRSIWERTRVALDELILAAKCMPNRYMRKTFDLEKLEQLVKEIATKPYISKKKRKRGEKPEYVKDEELFHFCMSVVRNMNLEARNLVIEDVSKPRMPLFLNPYEQAILTKIFYTISPKKTRISRNSARNFKL